MSKQHIYVIRKYVKASSALDAIKKEKSIVPSDVWIEEQSQKNFIDDALKQSSSLGFSRR